jgi:aminopeptidase N
MLKMADISKVTALALSLCLSGFASSQAVNQVAIDTPLGPSSSGALVATSTTIPSAISPVEIEPIHHSLRIALDPFNQSLIVEDTITFPDTTNLADIKFSLNENLAITNNSGTLSQLPASTPARGIGINNTGSQSAGFNRYSLRLTRSSRNQVSLIYSGSVYDLAEQESAEYAQSFADTSGIIGEQGVYLNKGSLWIPDFGNELITFDLQVEFEGLAASWTAVSQGNRRGANGWRSNDPMEEVYLIAADFTEYAAEYNDIDVLAYLRTPDKNLATKYLDATERYLALYEPLLGDYPYGKFALIENFWETGYGMPSFTLLGEQVIRFPFILESSYPHEILHNWWGNGVYPDYESGNWSEGLTAYLADHLFREMDGAGSEYRKEMLARYKNYVAEDDDFALSRFTSRNSAASQAVGYGKTLMLWHMLRIEIGDELFLTGLRKFYQDFKFRRASFSDIAGLFTEVAGTDLTAFFEQWVTRIGAPSLSFSVTEVGDNQARIMFAQIQPESPYALTVPVALYYQGEAYPEIYDISLSQKIDGVIADDYDKLEGILVDPYFDVFRSLDREETPATIGELFGANEITFILPQSNRRYWQQLAESFAEGKDADIVFDNEIASLPSGRSVWVLGKDNRFSDDFSSQIVDLDSDIGSASVNIAGQEIELFDRSTVLVARHPSNSDLALGWIGVDDMIAIPGMIEKLPHYGKYSYLSFLGEEPTNDVKGVWSSEASPMRWLKPGLQRNVNWEQLPTTPALATLPAKYLPDQLLSHVIELTSVEMAGRSLGSKGIEAAAAYIAGEFRAAGIEPLSRGYSQTWTEQLEIEGTGESNDVNESAYERSVRLSNIFGVLKGSNPDLSGKPVVVGAHFDHLGIDSVTGKFYPGADDNASGVAIMLEVAAKLASSFAPQRPIIFAAFTGEESGLLGSKYFIENLPSMFNKDEIFAMVNLDSVGRLNGRELQVFGTESAYELPFMAQGIGFTTGLQSTFPQQTIASSDHVSFLNEGIPGIHLFAGVTEDYHRPSDTADKLDLDGMSDIALWLEEAIVYLADNTDPLRVTLAGASVPVQASVGDRDASLGTVPDFSYAGEGVRISAVSPGGAAAESGLEAGDVLLSFNGTALSSLQIYSNLIRESAAGEIVALEVLRAEQIISVQVTLKAR